MGKTPAGTYTTHYLPVAREIILALLDEGWAVRAEPFEDLYTIRWWSE